MVKMNTNTLTVYVYCLCSFLIIADEVNAKVCKVPRDGRTGVCINLGEDIAQCPTLHKVLVNKNFSEIYTSVCDEPNFANLNETQVCCAIDEFIELFPSIEESHDAHDNFKLLPSLHNSDCGSSLSSTTDRIVGGTNTSPGSHPWMARLGLQLEGESEVRFLCSGSIINNKYILTAAHCFKHGKLMVIRLGETDEEVDEECILVGINEKICQKPEDYQPEDIIIHPNYTGNVGSASDIALIRLNSSIRNLSSPFSRPVCLPFVDEFVLPDLENNGLSSTGAKNLLSVQGWGKEGNNDTSGTSQLKQLYVPLRSNVYCRHIFQNANLEITNLQICAGGTKDKGSCSGDSGSPLMLQSQALDKRTGLRMFQLGIVSYGRSLCGIENSPVVYTRVRPFLRWILDSIRE